MRLQQQAAFFLETHQLSWWVPIVSKPPPGCHTPRAPLIAPFLPGKKPGVFVLCLPGSQPGAAQHSPARVRRFLPSSALGIPLTRLLPAAVTFYGPWPQENIATATPNLLNVPLNQTACALGSVLLPSCLRHQLRKGECRCLATSGELRGQPLTTTQRRDWAQVLPNRLECRASGFTLLARRRATTSISDTGMLTASVLSTPAFLCSSCHNLILGNVFFPPRAPPRDPCAQVSCLEMTVLAQGQPMEELNAGSPELSRLVLTHCLKWSPHRCSPVHSTRWCLTVAAAGFAAAGCKPDLSRVEQECLKCPRRM